MNRQLGINRMAIVHCQCEHEYQDRVYGKLMRVANPVNRLQRDGIYAVRCTVCGTVHTLTGKHTVSGGVNEEVV